MPEHTLTPALTSWLSEPGRAMVEVDDYEKGGAEGGSVGEPGKSKIDDVGTRAAYLGD